MGDTDILQCVKTFQLCILKGNIVALIYELDQGFCYFKNCLYTLLWNERDKEV